MELKRLLLILPPPHSMFLEMTVRSYEAGMTTTIGDSTVMKITNLNQRSLDFVSDATLHQHKLLDPALYLVSEPRFYLPVQLALSPQ